MSRSSTVANAQAASAPRGDEVLSPSALAFLAELHDRFGARRQALLDARKQAQAGFDAGGLPGFLAETAAMRSATWQVAPAPADLQRRWVEITGPVERKMMINALNSGADCFMADLEDAHSPTWPATVAGQGNLIDAVRGRLAFTSPEGKHYQVNDAPAVLLVRPRGWHLPENAVTVRGEAMAASLVDAGLFLFHNAKELLARGTGPYLYLPKMQHHLEAQLWHDVLSFAEERLGLPASCVRCTVLIETLPAAFQMEEILWQLRSRIVGLNAGRWDYLFSTIKTLRTHPDKILPDRSAVTMAAPFLRAYATLLVATCHKRGAHAMGGMAAFIPNRRDAAVTERAVRKVREDKQREAGDGFDGTWVAHPDLVPIARAPFARVLRDEPNQLGKRTTVVRDAAALLDLRVPGAAITEDGVRHNLRAALLYTESWLRGVGAVAIDNLMEDAATAEISRSQVWQWLHHHARLNDGRTVDERLVRDLLGEETARAADGLPAGNRLQDAAAVLAEVVFAPTLSEFLTLVAYGHLSTSSIQGDHE
ncbi:MAG: malate synthase A [Candidatus Thermoplasmatota archaeon]